MILRLIRVENFSIFEAAEAVFEPGLVAISGESGSGKTLLFEALRLAIGGRPEASVVRSGCDQAVVMALFEVGPGEIHDAGDEDGQILFSRQISANGRSIFRINDQVVTASAVRRLGAQLVDMTSQGEPAEILSPSRQRSLLDDYAGLGDQVARRAGLRSQIRQIEAQAKELGGDERSRRRQTDLLGYQIEEIHSARLEAGEEDSLRQRRRLLAERAALAEALASGRLAILGGGRPGAYDLLARAEAAVGRFGDLVPELSAWVSEAGHLLELLQDLGQRLAEMQDGMELAAQDGAQLEERLLLIEDLKRKYGDDVESVLAYAETAGLELERLADAESALARLEAERAALSHEADELDSVVWNGRRQAAGQLAAEVEAELRFLGFPSANFRVDVAEESVSFWLQPNPGEPAQPAGQIASGGEQSRLLLALRQVAKAKEPRILLLDEVDQGLGGDGAQAVARRLRELSELGQVVAVTHQAVVAAYADQHLAVSKEVRAGRTLGIVRKLDAEERVQEVARMLAGTRQGLGQDHARELLRLSRLE